MFWKRDHPIIKVYFYDAATGKIFRQSKMPREMLPESFEPETKLTIGEQNWIVRRADPMTAAEFRRTGELRLVVESIKVTTADPREVLFSLATIADELPAIAAGSTKLDKNVIEMHEDDWRQVEFVSATRLTVVKSELDEIRKIHEHHRDGL